MTELIRQDIVQGASKRVNLDVKIVIDGRLVADKVIIRPLTYGELIPVLSKVEPLGMSPDGTLDASKAGLAKHLEAYGQAASLGLVEPKISLEELYRAEGMVPAFIGAKILEISGVAAPDAAKKKDAK
jgi:hypothetical protein